MLHTPFGAHCMAHTLHGTLNMAQALHGTPPRRTHAPCSAQVLRSAARASLARHAHRGHRARGGGVSVSLSSAPCQSVRWSARLRHCMAEGSEPCPQPCRRNTPLAAGGENDMRSNVRRNKGHEGCKQLSCLSHPGVDWFRARDTRGRSLRALSCRQAHTLEEGNKGFRDIKGASFFHLGPWLTPPEARAAAPATRRLKLLVDGEATRSEHTRRP